VGELESFATDEILKLKQLSPTEKRSERSMLDLVEDIGRRGGLAIPAHVDLGAGMCGKLGQSELTDLLCSPMLAGLEFARRESLETWFTKDDTDADRVAAWKARRRDPELRDRGLARLMSSDAHTPEQVGQDRSSRTLTRLRLDERNFHALRNAIQLNPKARCKAEAILPAAYPRILHAEFEGGFLDGVSMDFTGNLNCLVGGRGSGKSTALLSIRAALGADAVPEEDPDDPDRMPEKTTVTFVDNTGSERVAIRERSGEPMDAAGSPIRLRLADLGQDESGRLARGYEKEPEVLLEFLDGFIVKHSFEEAEATLLAELADNNAELTRTQGAETKIAELEKTRDRLEATLKAATESNIDEIARWATMLASQRSLLEAIDSRVTEALSPASAGAVLDLDALAQSYGADLDSGLAGEFVGGEAGLRARLEEFAASRKALVDATAGEIGAAGAELRRSVDAWKAKQAEYEAKMTKRREELKTKGLEVQAGAVVEVGNRLGEVNKQLVALVGKREDHRAAKKRREDLLASLRDNRQRLFEVRKATLKQIATEANYHSDDLTIRVAFEREGIRKRWCEWLTSNLPLREPRVGRVAEMIGPQEFAEKIVRDLPGLAETESPEAGRPFTEESLTAVRSWPQIFELETMRLEDRPRIDVQRRGASEAQGFDHLSAGQQRSVLLSLLLCAERSDPLVLDQPEDHLDGRYIAGAVVRHLEAAKERRQVLIATHSANLVVLGDAELVVPMQVRDGRGEPYAVGAVDRTETRDQVCALLEGGTHAYRKRGERYGFTFASEPDDPGPS
jgi:energy-coupling factor transporter ATP-binding protein EcfA2